MEEAPLWVRGVCLDVNIPIRVLAAGNLPSTRLPPLQPALPARPHHRRARRPGTASRSASGAGAAGDLCPRALRTSWPCQTPGVQTSSCFRRCQNHAAWRFVPHFFTEARRRLLLPAPLSRSSSAGEGRALGRRQPAPAPAPGADHLRPSSSPAPRAQHRQQPGTRRWHRPVKQRSLQGT